MPEGSKRIHFYFDYVSSNTYLAWAALPDLAAKHGAEIDPVPALPPYAGGSGPRRTPPDAAPGVAGCAGDRTV
ncbi:MAG: hypothetical protein ACE5FC_10915 [Myxococcota bacterium]